MERGTRNKKTISIFKKRHLLLLRQMGVCWLVYRAWYAFLRRSGFLRRRCPVVDWSLATPNGQNPGEIVDLEAKLKRYASEDSAVFEEANAILSGRFRFFSFHEFDVGFPPSWNRNPFTGQELDSDRHWSEIDDFSQGDIKCIWELSRFDWVFPLVRAYVRSKDIRYYEGFRELLKNWMSSNPPNAGPQWKCGQETALRMRALYFALIGFRPALGEDPETEARLHGFLYESAKRIEANLGYALSQNSNHEHTELLGLLIGGLIFSEDPVGKRWLALFEKHIASTVTRLNFESGGGCMYSMVYHRMMLDCLVLMVVLARRHDYTLPGITQTRLKQAANFLYPMIDLETGHVPIFGSNDGAHILPLSSCSFHDFRPLAQTLFWITADARSFGEGPWDEQLVWLGATPSELERFGKKSLPSQTGFHDASDSGFVTVREGNWQIGVRVGKQRFRPGPLNHLALLVDWKGQELLISPGTYSYNAPRPFDHLFKETRCQNTAFVGVASQMMAASRFLAVPWLSSELLTSSSNSLEMRFHGFPDVQDGATHHRTLQWSADRLVIEDRITTEAELPHGIHWLLPDLEEHAQEGRGFCLRGNGIEIRVNIETPADAELKSVRESKDGRWGYRSRYYQQIEPARSLVAVSRPARETRFRTTIEVKET